MCNNLENIQAISLVERRDLLEDKCVEYVIRC